MRQISVPAFDFEIINRLYRRLNVEGDYSGNLLRNGEVVGYKTSSNPVGRIIFNLYT